MARKSETDIGKYIADRTAVDRNGCWVWLLAKHKDGYGFCYRRDWRGLAHRFAYHHLVSPIPENLQLDHLCRNKSCVNPDHLEPVTPIVNVRRGNHAVHGRNHSIYYQRTKNLWAVAVDFGGGKMNGKRRRKVFTSKDKGKAMAKADAWIAEGGERGVDAAR